MTKKNKTIIDTYPTLYDVDLVVANKYTTFEQLDKLYKYASGNSIDKDIKDGVASTSICIRKSDNKYCILVCWNDDLPRYKVDNKKKYTIDTIAHESCHVALDIYDYIQEDAKATCSEPFSYLVGWIAGCIYTTISKK